MGRGCRPSFYSPGRKKEKRGRFKVIPPLPKGSKNAKKKKKE